MGIKYAAKKAGKKILLLIPGFRGWYRGVSNELGRLRYENNELRAQQGGIDPVIPIAPMREGQLELDVNNVLEFYEQSFKVLKKWDVSQKIPNQAKFNIERYLRSQPRYDSAFRAALVQISDHANFEELVARLESFLHVFSDSAQLHNSLGVLYFFQGRLLSASISFSAAVKLDGEFEEARQNLVMVRQSISSCFEWNR